MSVLPIFAAVGAKALYLLYLWLLSAIVASMLSRSKGYGERAGLGTGLLLSVLAPIIWLVVPPRDEDAEWHSRKPWQRRRKPRESEMTGEASAGTATALAGGRPGGGRLPPVEGERSSAPADRRDAGGISPVDESGGAGSRPGESRG